MAAFIEVCADDASEEVGVFPLVCALGPEGADGGCVVLVLCDSDAIGAALGAFGRPVARDFSEGTVGAGEGFAEGAVGVGCTDLSI